MLKKVTLLIIAFGLFSTGVYAGTVIKQYKTPRGNFATVENMEMHKGRIGITINGEVVKKETLYNNSTTYVPLRAVSELLGAEVVYNNESMSADITLSNSTNQGQGNSSSTIANISLKDRLKTTETFMPSLHNNVSVKKVNGIKYEYTDPSYDTSTGYFYMYENVCKNAPKVNVLYNDDTHKETYKYTRTNICGTIKQIEEILDHELEEGFDLYYVSENDSRMKLPVAAHIISSPYRPSIIVNVSEFSREDMRVVTAHETVHAFQDELNIMTQLWIREGGADYIAKDLIQYTPNQADSHAEFIDAFDLDYDSFWNRVFDERNTIKIDFNNIQRFDDIVMENTGTVDPYFLGQFVWRFFNENYKDSQLLDAAAGARYFNDSVFKEKFSKDEKTLIEEWKKYIKINEIPLD